MRQNTPLRLSGVTLLFTIVLVCVAVLAALCAATAHADLALAQKYADQTQTLYADRADWNGWLARLDAAALKGGPLPDEAVRQQDTVQAELRSDHNRILTFEADLTGGHARVTRWQISADWAESGSQTLWPGTQG